ncbi:hypothetical protein D3C83_181710 [compost metagenome]
MFGAAGGDRGRDEDGERLDPFRRGDGDLFSEEEICAYRQMRAVLLAGTDRQHNDCLGGHLA